MMYEIQFSPLAPYGREKETLGTRLDGVIISAMRKKKMETFSFAISVELIMR